MEKGFRKFCLPHVVLALEAHITDWGQALGSQPAVAIATDLSQDGISQSDPSPPQHLLWDRHPKRIVANEQPVVLQRRGWHLRELSPEAMSWQPTSRGRLGWVILNTGPHQGDTLCF